MIALSSQLNNEDSAKSFIPLTSFVSADNHRENNNINSPAVQLSRAQGCFLGQFSGDAFGGLFEIESDRFLSNFYRKKIINLFPGGILNTQPGRLSSYSELAIVLARTLTERSYYQADSARSAYIQWLESEPEEVDNTIYMALNSAPNTNVQTSSVLTRASTLGIFHFESDFETIIEDSRLEAEITHTNPVATQVNILLTLAIAHVVRVGPEPIDLYRKIILWANSIGVSDTVAKAITDAASKLPASFHARPSWVVTALHNALWHLLHSSSLDEALTKTVMSGGDTRGNATICGMLLGAAHGRKSVPNQWIRHLLVREPVSRSPATGNVDYCIYPPLDALIFADRSLRA